jgi:hypothetical protein
VVTVCGVAEGIGTGVCFTVEGDEGRGCGVVAYAFGTPFGFGIVEPGNVVGSAGAACVRGSGGTMTRVAAGDGSVSTALTAFSVALRSEASSFFFLQRDAPHNATQRIKMATTAVSIFGKKFLILKEFFTTFLGENDKTRQMYDLVEFLGHF